MKPRIREVIVVEGRYDHNTLAQVVDATVVELGGFAVFHDAEKLALLRRLAETRGLILLTDSDGAGFVIRNHLKGALPKDKVCLLYTSSSRRAFPPSAFSTPCTWGLSATPTAASTPRSWTWARARASSSPPRATSP